MPLIAEAIRTGWPVVSGCQPLAAERFDGQGLPRSNRTATEMATWETYIPNWSSVPTSPPDDRPPTYPSGRGHLKPPPDFHDPQRIALASRMEPKP